MLYRDVSPVSKTAWNEIDERAVEVLKSYLASRRVVHVEGPKGLDFNSIPEGRLTDLSETDGVSHGIYQVEPLIETRVEFEINRWELDNVNRGALDVDYAPLEEAMVKLALFEDKTVFDKLDEVMENEVLTFGTDGKSVMDAISQGVITLKEAFVDGPYTLVVSPEAYMRIHSEANGYPLLKRIEKLIDGEIIINRAITGAYLLPFDHDDLELTIGRDFSIGYQNHTNETVRFFAKESFTFRVLDEAIYVKYNL